MLRSQLRFTCSDARAPTSGPAERFVKVLQVQEFILESDDASDITSCTDQLAQLKVPCSIPTAAMDGPSVLSSCDLQGIAQYILSGKARSIVVMAGAGISVSSGIPDFRSPGTGLYSQLQRFNLPWPEAVFDIRFFRHNPKPFYLLAKELFPGGYMPTPAHYFIKLLYDKGLLLTAFTQNIDGLEQLAGLPADRVVPAHGSFDGARCIECSRACSMYAVQQAVFDNEVAICNSCGGLVKPDVVFFGEPLPARFHRRRLADLPQADLLIVMGTSLVVQPFAGMIGAVPDSIPRLLINMSRVGEQPCQHRQQQPAAKQQHSASAVRQKACASSSQSSSSDDSEDDRGSVCGAESDATGLTASSSFIYTDSGSSSDADAITSDSAVTTADAAAKSAAMSAYLDFDAGYRDVLHLGECDAGVTQLAALLGWQDDLHELINQGAQDFEESRRDWEA
eukprot:GHRR01005163.1.p1 GENE.GHRR01005163.1~~GHRR01005163.1.p1  ORF type:complete len:451 (+),score=183.15 GHRR01005163.1:273-1625(+)